MSRKIKQQEPSEEWQQHKCDECRYGKWNDVHWNRDLEGKPITLRCPFYKDGNVGIIRGTRACELFKAKQ